MQYNLLCLGNVKTLSGFEIRGDVFEITIVYDTLLADDIEYPQNVRTL